MEKEHSVRARIEKPTGQHECPQCEFEDPLRGKLTRHKVHKCSMNRMKKLGCFVNK